MAEETQPTGDCFEAALRFLTARGEAFPDRYVLVHGNAATLKQDEMLNHAWVEEGDIVHEVSNGRHLPFQKAKYYQRFCIQNTRRYSYEEALIASVENAHSGPWCD